MNIVKNCSVWNLLTGKGVMDSTASVVLHDVKEIETWILRLLSAPVPVPGKTRVEVRNNICISVKGF